MLDELYDTNTPTSVTFDPKYFKLPIEYIQHDEINDIVKNDIELNSNNSKNIYNNLIPESILVDKWCSNYTTNKPFLKDTQQHIKHYSVAETISESMFNEYKKFKEDGNFIDKYQYMSIKVLKPLNNYSVFLQCLGFFNLASPALSLLSPLFVLIVPFVILKLRGIKMNISTYIIFLKGAVMQNSFYKLFTNFGTMNAQQKLSGCVSILFYIFQVYNNVMSCINFYRNIHTISGFIFKYKDHLKSSIMLCEKVQTSVKKYESYTSFYNDIEHHKNEMNKLFRRIDVLMPYNNTLSKLSQLGVYMHLYYDMYYNEKYNETFMYSIFLKQYDTDLSNFNKHVRSKKINKCKYGSVTSMRKMYYLPHIQNKYVSNDINIDKNIIITGPNASGKTTILKSVLINVLLSQQIGYGCYSSAKIKLYDTFHSYLNIPDTSGRDSLFQAEARRCKDILQLITETPDNNHFCIFDEIYSGTNPNDAVLCANLYLKGMNHFKASVDYILTTHYIKLCENFDKEPLIQNLKMNVDVKEDKINYLYEIVSGISYVHGGKHILKEMNYPEYLFKL
jgi:energy-coupling factor transporter ATP-binding protein EcfA2